jgi:hypothetical protein
LRPLDRLRIVPRHRRSGDRLPVFGHAAHHVAESRPLFLFSEFPRFVEPLRLPHRLRILSLVHPRFEGPHFGGASDFDSFEALTFIALG